MIIVRLAGDPAGPAAPAPRPPIVRRKTNLTIEPTRTARKRYAANRSTRIVREPEPTATRVSFEHLAELVGNVGAEGVQRLIQRRYQCACALGA
jgi:hypothetical protein